MLERWWRGDVSERSIGKDFGVENDVTYMENTSGFLLLENRCSFRVLFSDLPIYNSVYSILSTLRLVMTTLLLFCCWACPTLVTPDYNLPDSSVLGISQARILESVAIFFSRGSSWPRDWTFVSCISKQSLPLNHQGSHRVGVKMRFYDLRSPVEFQNSFEKADIT